MHFFNLFPSLKKMRSTFKDGLSECVTRAERNIFDLCLRPTWRANNSYYYICSSYFSPPQRFCAQKSQVFSSAQSLGHCDLPKRKCILCQMPRNVCVRFLPSSTIRDRDGQSSQLLLTASRKTQTFKLSTPINIRTLPDNLTQPSNL